MMNPKHTPKLLFVCSRNQWRSPTAEKIYRQHGFSTRSAGTSPRAKKTISVDDIKWSDLIFVMEAKHKQRIVAQFTRLVTHKPIIVLNIPDQYQFMEPELVSILHEGVSHHLETP